MLEKEILNQYIRSMELEKTKIPSFNTYPFNLTAIKELGAITFHPKVTFFVGENGSGKSTILEAIAVAYGFNPEGGTKNFNFSSRPTHSVLHQYIRLVKGVKKPQDGFFLRAESFYNLATNIEELDAEGSFGPSLISGYGGTSLHEQSHGESFFAVFQNRFKGNSLYILDEPEAALSPARQMAMIARMHDLVQAGAQFIIATHSPILMAYPEATIYEIKEKALIVDYEDTEHFQVMKAFINHPQKMLNLLIK